MKNLNALEKTIKVSFQNKLWLKRALTHRSYLNEHLQEDLNSNERLEFLGDAVLEFIVSKKLFELFPHLNEGVLTTFRSQIVKTSSLAEAAAKFNLGDYLFLSKGEEETGGRKNRSLLANTFEALMGAIFLDQGLKKTEAFVELFLGKKIKTINLLENIKDYKSLFQEKAQEKEKITPNYRIISATGPDHDKIFTVGAFLNKKRICQGKGKSKQEAEQKAAQQALKIYAKN